MEVDAEGFGYPKVDMESCVDCGLCEKVCPLKNDSKRVAISLFMGYVIKMSI